MKKTLTLIAVLSVIGGGLVARAEDQAPPAQVQDVKADTQKIQALKQERREDVKKLREAKKAGDAAGIETAKAQVRQDTQEIRKLKRERRHDVAKIRQHHTEKKQ